MFFTVAGLLLSSQLYVKELVVPDGFKIELFASDVINARQLVLQQVYIDGLSVTVVFRNKAQYAGNGHSPCQVL